MAREIPVDPHNLDLRADITPGYDPTWDLLVDEVEELPELERSVVELLIWGGFTKVEAAEMLGISRSYVHKLWRRARGLLKEKLSDSY
jgi:DNA-directed RNA polymerase specialized sigma24 family protein|tara:strand:+ start:153 stop:416 length:264 start_codon:yes stop_codon:yes gene_type:complete